MLLPADRPLTYDDLAALPEDGLRHELIDGEHVVSPSPGYKHQRVLGNLYYIIRAFLQGRPLGEVLFAPLDVVFSPTNVAVPDLLYVSRERAGVLTDRNAQGAPDLVIEVLSPSTRKLDEVRKRDLYDRFGVAEYWLADPLRGEIRVYRRTPEGFRPAAALSAERGDVLTTELLPALEIPLTDVFA